MNIKGTLKKAIAYPMMLLIVMMYFAYAGPVSAAGITTRSLSLSSASPTAGATVSYLFTFTLPSNSSVNHVDMQFDTQPGMSGGLPGGFVGSAAGSTTMAGGTTTFSWGSPTEKLQFGTPAANTGAKTITVTGVTNPTTATVFYAKITSYGTSDTSAPIDTGIVASATVSTVTVTGTQLESLTASVAAKTSGTVCSSTTVLNTTTATAINFGNFNGTTAISAAQTVTIGSNATSGVSAKLVENQILTGPSTIADFGTGTDLAAGTAWSDGVSTGFGVCAKGNDANTTNFGAGGTLYKSLLTTAKTIASTAGPTNSTGTDVEFRVAVPANLQAGVYTNTLTYNILANY